MPRKRTGPVLALSDLSFDERFALISSWWAPGIRGHDDLRFHTWQQYFDVFESVRDELLPLREWPCFASLALPIFRAGGDPATARATHDAAFRRYMEAKGWARS